MWDLIKGITEATKDWFQQSPNSGELSRIVTKYRLRWHKVTNSSLFKKEICYEMLKCYNIFMFPHFLHHFLFFYADFSVAFRFSTLIRLHYCNSE